jgi:hypothetical protein
VWVRNDLKAGTVEPVRKLGWSPLLKELCARSSDDGLRFPSASKSAVIVGSLEQLWDGVERMNQLARRLRQLIPEEGWAFATVTREDWAPAEPAP